MNARRPARRLSAPALLAPKSPLSPTLGGSGQHTPPAALACCRAARRPAQGHPKKSAEKRLCTFFRGPALALVTVAAHRSSPWAWRGGVALPLGGPGGLSWWFWLCGGVLWLVSRCFRLVRWWFPVVRWCRRFLRRGGVRWSARLWRPVRRAGVFVRLGGRFPVRSWSLASVVRLPRRRLLRLGRHGLASRSRFAGLLVQLGRCLVSPCRSPFLRRWPWPLRCRCPRRWLGWLSCVAPSSARSRRWRCGLSLALACARLSPRSGRAVRLRRARRFGLSPCAAVRSGAAAGLGSAGAVAWRSRRPAVASLASLRWPSRPFRSPSSAWAAAAGAPAWWPFGLARASPFAGFAQARAAVLAILGLAFL